MHTGSAITTSTAEPIHSVDRAGRINRFAAPVLISLVVSVLIVYVWHQMPDDAYIYLRMAENLTHDQGWAFNPGVPVNAATSPFYALFLTALVALHLPGLATALVLAGICGTTVLIFCVFEESLSLGTVPAAALAFAASTFPTLLKSSGLETPVYLALICLTASALQRRKFLLMGLLAGVTALGRPEGCLLLPIVLALELVRSRRLPWGALVTFLLPVIPWLLFSRFEFGTIVPHTMKIKALQSSVGFWSDSWFLEFVAQLSAAKWLLPLVVWGAIRIFSGVRRNVFLPAVVSFGIVQTVGYTVLKAPAKYFWYDAPGDLAYYLALVAGILTACQFLSKRFPAFARLSPIPVLLGFMLLDLIGSAAWAHSHAGLYRFSSDYKQVGQWMRTHSSKQDWIAGNEIGYLAVYSNRPIRDMLGLADPNSVDALTHHRWDWWFTEGPKPRFILVHIPRWIGEPGYSATPWPATALKSLDKLYEPVYKTEFVQVYELRQAVTTQMVE